MNKDDIFDSFFGERKESPQFSYFMSLLYAPDSNGTVNVPFHGETWLAKSLFIISKAIPESEIESTPQNFGPNVPILQSLEEQSKNSGLLIVDQKKKYLSEKGIEQAEKLWNSLPSSSKKIISNIKRLIIDMDYEELISYMYSTFPEDTVNSEILDGFNNKRLSSSISLFRKGKISLTKGAEIADISLEEYRNKLIKLKIPLFS